MPELTVSVRKDVFRSWLKAVGYTKTKLADEMKVSKGRISQVLASGEEPSSRMIAGFLRVTNLPFERLFVVKGRRKKQGQSGQARKNGRAAR